MSDASPELIIKSPPKRPGWLKALSLPVGAAVMHRAIKDGYGCEYDAWVSDLLTTAYLSPNGMIVRLSRCKPGQPNGDPDEGAHPELPLTNEGQ